MAENPWLYNVTAPLRPPTDENLDPHATVYPEQPEDKTPAHRPPPAEGTRFERAVLRTLEGIEFQLATMNRREQDVRRIDSHCMPDGVDVE